MKNDKLLNNILLVQSASFKEHDMIRFLKNHAKDNGYHYFKDHNNIYMTKGRADIYPCFVAHTDTCADIIPTSQFTVWQRKGMIFGYNPILKKQTQVGFDDKIGIYIALKMLAYLPAGKAFFPHAEESGCVGSGKAKMDFFDDCGYAIQCDRRDAKGITDDILGVEVLSTEFKEILKKPMKKFNRKFVSGGLTDVYTLKVKGLPVVCMNIECGYYNAHQSTDYCNVKEVHATLNFVKDIVKVAGNKKWEHKYVEKSYGNSTYNNYYNRYNGADDFYGKSSGYYGNNYTSKNYTGYNKSWGTNYGKKFSDDWIDVTPLNGFVDLEVETAVVVYDRNRDGEFPFPEEEEIPVTEYEDVKDDIPFEERFYSAPIRGRYTNKYNTLGKNKYDESCPGTDFCEDCREEHPIKYNSTTGAYLCYACAKDWK